MSFLAYYMKGERITNKDIEFLERTYKVSLGLIRILSSYLPKT